MTVRRSLLCALPLASACYTYAPIEPSAALAGTSVRARVSAAAAEQFAPLLGASDARLLDGTVIANGPDTLTLEVPSVLRTRVGSTLQTLHQRLPISRGQLLELETRRLDRTRTAVVAGSAAVVVGAVVIALSKDDPPKEEDSGNGGGNELRIRLWRFRD